MGKFTKYTDFVKDLPDAIDKKEFKKIAETIEKSRDDAQKDLKAQIPLHRDILKKAASQFKDMQAELKKSKDTKALKEFDEVIKQCDAELAAFNDIA